MTVVVLFVVELLAGEFAFEGAAVVLLAEVLVRMLGVDAGGV